MEKLIIIKDLEIRQIADLIEADWKKVYFGAKPYLMAMFSLSDINDRYGSDSAASIISYFLANAQTWRGEQAKEIKKVLNKMTADYYSGKTKIKS